MKVGDFTSEVTGCEETLRLFGAVFGHSRAYWNRSAGEG